MRCWSVGVVVMAALFMGLSGCSVFSEHGEHKEGHGQAVALSDLPAPARATIERLTAGGEIKKLGKEERDETVVYDVEARVGGKDVEYDVDSNGNIVTSEESVPYESLPAAVRAAAEKYFGSSEGIEASREIEEGKTFYEVAGKKGTAKKELKLTETGEIAEEEEEE